MLAARKVKSVGRSGLGVVKVTFTGLNVPGVNGGMFTTAFVGVPTTVIDCVPVPALTWSMVTEPGPCDTPKEGIPPGKRSPSLTVVNGVQTCVVAGELVKVTCVTPATIPNSPLNVVVRDPAVNGGSMLVVELMPETTVFPDALSVMVTVEP